MARQDAVIDWPLFSGGSSGGMEEYCRYQERATAPLIVDEDDRPFDAPEPRHVAAIREYMRRLRDKEPV